MCQSRKKAIRLSIYIGLIGRLKGMVRISFCPAWRPCSENRHREAANIWRRERITDLSQTSRDVQKFTTGDIAPSSRQLMQPWRLTPARERMPQPCGYSARVRY